MKKVLVGLIAGAMLLVAAPATADMHGEAGDGHDMTIVATVIAVSGDPGELDDKNKKDFDILRDLVVAAGLVDVLNAADGITVLAPDDRAFQRLASDLGYSGKYDEQAIFDFLVENAGSIAADVLAYHVLTSEYTNKELKKFDSFDTLQGDPLASKNKKFIDAEDDLKNAKLQGVKDVATSNGYIQGIDRVLIPVDLVS